MPASDQNINPERYQIVPRVLVFAWRGELLLLLKIKGKGRWDGRYNGLGATSSAAKRHSKRRGVNCWKNPACRPTCGLSGLC